MTRDPAWWHPLMMALNLATIPNLENIYHIYKEFKENLIIDGRIFPWNPYCENNSYNFALSPPLDEWEKEVRRPADLPFCNLHNMSEYDAAKRMMIFIIHHIIMKYKYYHPYHALRICPGKGSGYMANEMMKVLAKFSVIEAKINSFNHGVILVKL